MQDADAAFRAEVAILRVAAVGRVCEHRELPFQFRRERQDILSQPVRGCPKGGRALFSTVGAVAVCHTDGFGGRRAEANVAALAADWESLV